jgi:nickel transport system substrate-binding protein
VLTTRDETERQALYRDILTRLHDEAVYLPISYVSTLVVAKPELGVIPFALSPAIFLLNTLPR